MKNNTLKYTVLFSLLATPLVSFAILDGVRGLLMSVRGLVNTVIPVLFGLSMVFFFWGISQFILHAGDAKTREEGKQKMIWGVIALFVFVSIFGILQFVGSLVGISTDNSGLINNCPPGTADNGSGSCVSF